MLLCVILTGHRNRCVAICGVIVNHWLNQLFVLRVHQLTSSLNVLMLPLVSLHSNLDLKNTRNCSLCKWHTFWFVSKEVNLTLAFTHTLRHTRIMLFLHKKMFVKKLTWSSIHMLSSCWIRIICGLSVNKSTKSKYTTCFLGMFTFRFMTKCGNSLARLAMMLLYFCEHLFTSSPPRFVCQTVSQVYHKGSCHWLALLKSFWQQLWFVLLSLLTSISSYSFLLHFVLFPTRPLATVDLGAQTVLFATLVSFSAIFYRGFQCLQYIIERSIGYEFSISIWS